MANNIPDEITKAIENAALLIRQLDARNLKLVERHSALIANKRVSVRLTTTDPILNAAIASHDEKALKSPRFSQEVVKRDRAITNTGLLEIAAALRPSLPPQNANHSKPPYKPN